MSSSLGRKVVHSPPPTNEPALVQKTPTSQFAPIIILANARKRSFYGPTNNEPYFTCGDFQLPGPIMRRNIRNNLVEALSQRNYRK
ncbi:hypothetical protein TNCT_138891 [Trichonephila clavata]|uniref:Uncharacterized protein n=1 Tax=Trichonephila clavata TaxID=2740835 RepID=A0A8X6HXC1_TRICU|nr:hypothetical protein TNCT_138891 [Trichonephila clavata]